MAFQDQKQDGTFQEKYVPQIKRCEKNGKQTENVRFHKKQTRE